MCAITKAIDCDAVDASPYSEVKGFPVSALGIIFFLVIIFLTLFVFIRDRAFLDIAVVLIIFLSSVSILYSLFLAYVSIFVIKSVCIFCFITYLCNIGILAASLLWARRSEIAIWPTLLNKTWPNPSTINGLVHLLYYVFLVGLVCLSLITTRVTQNRYGASISDATIEKFFKTYDRLPKEEVNIQGSPWRGKKDSKVILVAFSDFQCPFCRISAIMLDSILHQFKDSVKFVFKHYPIDKTCNPYLKNSLHQNACLSAKAAVCAQEQGKFWEYHDYLFIKATKFDQRSLIHYGNEIGLNLERFTACLDSPEPFESISRDIEDAIALGIPGTPTFFLNGRKLPNLPPKVWVKILQREKEKE